MDGTLQIWNSETGTPIDEPLHGHTGAVLSVAYSLNGTQIISGSDDNTILIWDSYTHATIKGPLRGHTGSICSVAYSLNGTHIVSGSEDHTIIIWDPTTGTPSQEPLKGHTGAINSIACSPTRLHVASGSDDHTVQVWDLQTGRLIYEPLRGHTMGITAVAYSPDGNYIVSASRDITIRIWDSMTGTLIRTPFIGHTNLIKAIAFCPDGKHIASGGRDNRIRVWDTQIGILSTELLKSCTGFIQSSVCSHVVKSASANPLRSMYDLVGQSQALPFQSFWDPYRKQFISIQLQQEGVTQAHQGADNKLDQEAKNIEVTHTSHPLIIQSDGWLRTVNGELVTHVPNEHWARVCDMSVMCIPNDAPGHSIRLDWDKVYDAWDKVRGMME